MKHSHSLISASFRGLSALAVVASGVLLLLDGLPGVSPGLHSVVSAFPLLLVAVAYLGHQARRRPQLGAFDFCKAALLSTAFLLWAAHQLYPALPHAALLNDGAIALFVFDTAIVVLGQSGARLQSRPERERSARRRP